MKNPSDKLWCVYIHINKINNKSYIGQTSLQPPSLRWNRKSRYRDNIYFKRAIDKYGWDNFEHVIFQDNLTLEEANTLERRLILLFETWKRDIGYNIALGGNQSGKHSEETKAKIRANHADFSGSNHPNYGKKLSQETKAKIAASHTGKKYSPERCQQISQRTKGDKNPRAKTVKCINNGMIFTTAKAAGEWANIDFSGICKCCNGKQHTCGSFNGEKLRWEYI